MDWRFLSPALLPVVSDRSRNSAMVFPRCVPPQRDPEELAEEELNRQNGNPTKPAAPKPKPEKSEDAISQGSSTSNGSDAQGCSSSKVNATKESKAERKKRCRGVSGSSIKKDGGKFDLGLEDFDDLEIDSEEEEEYQAEAYQAEAYHEYEEQEPEPEEEQESPAPPPEPKGPKSSALWQETLTAFAKKYHDRVTLMIIPLVHSEPSHAQAMVRLHDELTIFFAQNATGILSDDLYFNYRLTTAIAQGMFEDSMIRVICYFEFCRDHPDIVNGHRNHVIDFLRFVKKTIDKFSNNPLIPQPPFSMVVPKAEIDRMAVEFCMEHNTQKTAQQLEKIDIGFHCYFILEVGKRAINEMSLDLMYFVVSAFKEFYDNCIISDVNIRIGITRLAKDAQFLEHDVPCAAALLHLFSSYALASLPVTEECFSMLPPPKHFLSNGNGGKLIATAPTGELPNLSVKNYFLLN